MAVVLVVAVAIAVAVVVVLVVVVVIAVAVASLNGLKFQLINAELSNHLKWYRSL